MPKVSRFPRASHRETSVGRFLQQTSAFPAQVRKVSFEDSSSSCSNSESSCLESNPLVATSAAVATTTFRDCSRMYPSIQESSSTVSQDESLPSRNQQETTTGTTSSVSPLHRSTAYESLNEQQFLLQQQKHQDQSKQRLLRRPTTSLCLTDLASSSSRVPCDDDEDLALLSPHHASSSSRPSPASSPWGHFVDVIPMDSGDCNSYSLPSSSALDSDNLEDGYFHPDALLFWSQCSSNNDYKSGHRKSHRFEPYKTSTRLCRKPSPPMASSLSSEAFSDDFMLPPSHCSSEQPVARSMRLTREVEETMERLHF